MDKNKVNANEFVEKFMDGRLDHLIHIQTPIKIFRVRDIAPHLRIPIPPIFFGYNLIIHLTEGYFQQQIESTNFSVQSPAVLICNYGHISAITAVDRLAEGYCVLIKEDAMTSLFREQEILNIFTIAPLLNLDKQDNEEFSQLLGILYNEIYASNPYKSFYESILKTVLLKVIKLSESNKNLGRAQEIAISYKQLIHLHFKKRKDVAYYADLMAVSLNYLNRCVSKVFKKSAKQLILEVAIIHSQLLLTETNKTIANIAYELEFEDPSYFARLFKKIVGLSPSEYRSNTLESRK